MMIIREYQTRDWEALKGIHDAARMYELEKAGLPEAFLPLEETYENEDLFGYRVAVAEQHGDVLGFIAFTQEEIGWLYVRPCCMRRGVGRALVGHAQGLSCGRMTLEILCGNDPAEALYHSMGFVTVDTRSGKMPGNEAFAVRVQVMEYARKDA